MPRVVVIGGGIAGLASAWRTRESARQRGLPLELIVLEREANAGGKIGTISEGGFVCERGPNGFLDNEPASLRLVDDLGLRPRLRRSLDAARRRFVCRDGQLHELHMHPLRFMSSSLMSLSGRLRMAMEPFIARRRGGAEETVGEFGRRRLGREFTEVMLDSMVSGIFAGDVDRLSVGAAFPKVIALEREYGGLIRGMVAKSRAARDTGKGPVSAGPGGTLHSFEGGMGEPIRALAAELETSLRYGQTARGLRRVGASLAVELDEETIEADLVVLAVPGPDAAELIGSACPPAASELAGIPIAGVHVVCTGYPRERVGHELSGFGALSPRRSGMRTLGTLWSSSAFEGRAPAGHVLLTTMIGGRHDPQATTLEDAELLQIVREETERVYGIEGAPVFHRVVRWPAGIPQYELGHLARVERAREALDALPGLLLTGNSVAGVSFNHCVADSERVAAAAIEQLASVGRETAGAARGGG